jgi:hypothetical protein
MVAELGTTLVAIRHDGTIFRLKPALHPGIKPPTHRTDRFAAEPFSLPAEITIFTPPFSPPASFQSQLRSFLTPTGKP